MGILIAVAIVAVLGIVLGLILSFAAKFMAVPVNEQIEKLIDILPGANCGACGYAGCADYAAALAKEEAPANLCTPGGAEVSQNISEFLGIAAEEVAEMYAIVRCCGNTDNSDYVMDYQGERTCEACSAMYQGRRSCSHACLGFGDCVIHCPYNALHIEKGIAVVDPDLCTGCGICARQCPKHIIAIVPRSSHVYVGCSSNDKGAFVRKLCAAGCIGCRKCEKTCAYGAITWKDNLAAIDPKKCTNCGACIEVCPAHVILKRQ